MSKQITNISELKQDDRNANRDTIRGRKAVADSLAVYGAGRSILVDRNGSIIAGNKTASLAASAGITDVIVVKTTGDKLVAVQRTDLDINDPYARELAIADNRTAELGLEWDSKTLATLTDEVDISAFFSGDELTRLIAPSLPTSGTGVGTQSTSVDPDEWTMECKCPRCGFQFDPAKGDK